MKAILIGRHVSFEIGDVEIARQINVLFPATATECCPVLTGLFQLAQEIDACLLFQAVPAQVATCFVGSAYAETGQPSMIPGIGPEITLSTEVWAIINKPTDRPEATVFRFENREYIDTPGMKYAVECVNPNAKCEFIDDALVVRVEPPMRFEFSHLERIL